MWVLPEFLGQRRYFAVAEVIGKRFRKESYFWMTGFLMQSMKVTVKAALLLEMQTSHGKFEIEVSREYYAHTHTGDKIRVKYQLSRLYSHNKNIEGKLAS